MKRTFLSLSFILILLAAMAAPAAEAAAKKSKKIPEFGFGSAKQFMAEVFDVNAAENFIIIREGKKGIKRKVLMNGAVVVKSTEAGTQSATLLDVVKGHQAHLWVKKKQVKKDYQALVLTQILGKKALDSQPPVVQFSAAASEGLENAVPALAVSLSKAAAKEVKVSYTVSGTATGSSTDYTLASGDLLIPAGQTSGALPFTLTNDTAQETDETVVVTLTAATEAMLGAQKVHTFTIKDDDQAGIGFGTTTSSGAESVASVNFAVTISAASVQQVTVAYAVSGTATGGGADYTLANGTATIPVGQTSVNITATVVDDTAIEGAETIVVTLSNPVGAALGSNTTHTYTINDNDQPTLGFGSSTSSGAESVTSVNIPVTLSAASPRETRVNYDVTSTATGGGTDYTLAIGTLTIPAGQTSGNITVTVVDDALDELDETVTLTLSNPIDAVLSATAVHTYTILDNDNPTVQFSSASNSGLENATPVTIGISLSAAAAAEVQVGYTLSGTATGGGTDYTLANGTATIAVGQVSANISLAIVDDAIADPNESVILTLANPVNASLGSTTVFTYTITDND